jgi:Domain of unknown function (DUF4352)
MALVEHPEAPSKEMVMRRVLVIGLVTAVGLAAACGTDSNTGKVVQAASPPPAQSAKAPAAPSSFKVGDLIKVGNTMLLTVTQVQAPVDSGNEFITPQKGQFMTVMVSMQNVSGKDQTVSSMVSFDLRDQSGQAYSETILPNAPKPPDGSVAPNDKLAGGLTYDVPRGTDFKLYYKNDLFSAGQVIVDLGQH